MLDLLKALDARLGEPSTWASVAGLFLLLHVNVDPGVWATVSTWGVIFAGALGIVLAEVGKKTPVEIAADVARAVFPVAEKALSDQPSSK